jgi:hypothetical protein
VDSAQSLTAVCVSIDRIPQNTAPTRCLPFDCIGVRHPGIPASASPHVDLQQARNLISLFAFRSEVSLASRSPRGGYALGFCGWYDSGNELRAGDLAPASCAMPGCRAPISSKGKQQIGAGFCGIRSIETQIAGSRLSRDAMVTPLRSVVMVVRGGCAGECGGSSAFRRWA